MIICAGNMESFSFAKPIGVGLVEASVKLSEIILKESPKNLLFIGSAGSYGKANIFDTICSNSAKNIEIGYLANYSYTPKISHLEGISSDVSHETSLNFLVNSSSYITSNKVESERFLNYGLDVENMEFFAVLSVAKYFNIDALGLFCVTNYCYEDAHQEFIKNYKKSNEILENELFKNFREYV